MYKVTRKGRRKITIIDDGRLLSEFYEIDNLDTKKVDQAANNYERVFVVMRDFLEKNEQFCCDEETDRLSLCQGIVDSLHSNLLIRKNEG